MSGERVDLDKQFQADLERAEALSLESLALEQFRKKKRQEESHIQSYRETPKPKVATVSRAYSLNETDNLNKPGIQVKSRPRPGMTTGALSHGGGGAAPQQHTTLIAPPPVHNLRRNSSATTPITTTTPPNGNNISSVETSATADLISFTTAATTPGNNELIAYCQQLHNSLNNQVATIPTINNISSIPTIPQYQFNTNPQVNYNVNTTFMSQPTTWSPYPQIPSNGNTITRNPMPHINSQNPLSNLSNMSQRNSYPLQTSQSVMPNMARVNPNSTMMQMSHSHTNPLLNFPSNFSQQSQQNLQQQQPNQQQQQTMQNLQQQTMKNLQYGAACITPFAGGVTSSAQPSVGITAGQQRAALPINVTGNGGSVNLQTSGNVLEPPSLPPKSSTTVPPPPTSSRTSTSSRRVAPPSSITAPSTSSSSVRSHRRQTSNLIDLATMDEQTNVTNVKVSILEAFDPLLCDVTDYDSSIRTLSPECSMYDTASVCGSVYDEYDPYDFIYTGSDSNSLSDPLYAAIVAKSDMSIPVSPPPNLPPRATPQTTRIAEEKLLLYDSIVPIENKIATRNPELNAFHQMVQNLRNQFKYNDPDTNMGFVISPMIKHTYLEETSIKLAVYPHYTGADRSKPINLTCDVTTSVEHITLQLTCDLEAPSNDQYTLKVWGYNEYLAPTSFLCDYEYVHNCIKLEQDVRLILIPDSMLDKSLARTLQDDNRDKEIKLQDIVPNEPNIPISYDNLKLLLVNLEAKLSLLIKSAEEIELTNNSNSMPSFQPIGVKQSVNFVVQLMGQLEILEITESLEKLDECCRTFMPQNEFRENRSGKKFSETVKTCCEKIRSAILELIRMYSQAFMVNFELKNLTNNQPELTRVIDINDYLVVRICALYRACMDWKYDDYMVAVQAYHGKRPIGHPVLSQQCTLEKTSTKILFDCWLDMPDIFVSSLARESRLVLVLYGRTLQPVDKDDKEATPQFNQEAIGWAAVQFFNYEGILEHGSMLLSVWPTEADYQYGPAPSAGTHPIADHPILGIELTVPPHVHFPSVRSEPAGMFPRGDFTSLDRQTREQLEEIVAQDTLSKIPIELREILWEKRHYLYEIPNALPRVLCSSHRWDWFCLADLHGMLKCWKPMEPVRALELLLPTFPDMEVRKLAISWIRKFDSDELVDYLPQLVVAFQHETYHNSPLAQFLLERAMKRPRVAHYLFWLLCHNLPGYMPQNSESDDVKYSDVSQYRHHRRTILLLRALLAICGEALRTCLISQQFLSKRLHEIAVEVQESKESHRIKKLHLAMEEVNQSLKHNPTSLPLSPTLQVSGVNVSSCSYFATNTLPLKISFLATDKSTIPAIFKVGDDLQQDHLTLQMVRIMNKLWLKEGLDLKMVAFSCVPTGKKRGIIEMVQKTETLRKIQVELGLTGSFKDKSIHEWLAKHNPSELEYARAVENFTASCAGYCVVTYILGICDRHNDNIMLKTSGHMFHIDFGKFLGDSQMFGNFKRDRTPFVLTSDMAYVINGGDKPSEKFQKFVDLCCQAFNIVRNNGNLFLYLVTFMAASGIKGLTTEAVAYLHRALMPGKSNPDAAACFTRLIESSLNSLYTQVNFFIHNIAAQLKFSNDQATGELLSFIPNKYSMETDGKLTEVQVVGYRKCYDPDKYYVYILQVMRVNVTEHARVLRTYKEFCELHQKLCINFPLAKLYSLSTGLQMGRSNIKQVAEKRLRDISLFLQSLFKTADEIAHSDLVYTFFHPLLRDQQLLEHLSMKKKDRQLEDKRDIGKVKGQLKLSLLFNKGVFTVMVQHARSLSLLTGGQAPSTYVKVYLMPDPTKTTKRKTKVVKKNCHPSFMEMLEYRMPLDVIKDRTLKATIWNSDSLQENEFLGGVEFPLADFDLTQEITEWYSLANVCR